MAITTLGTKTVLDSVGASVTVKTVNDSGDSSTSPAHGIVDGLGFQFDPSPRIFTGATITRPADTAVYAAGDVLATSTTLATANAAIASQTIQIARYADQPTSLLRMRLTKTGTTLTSGIFRVHLYRSQPVLTNADNGVWLTTAVANYVGSFDVTMSRAMSDGAIGLGSSTDGATIVTTPVSGQNYLFYVIEVRGTAYTPISGEVFTPIIEVN
jgi:hypothetical protein